MTSARTVLVLSNHGDIVGGGEVSLLALLKGLDRLRWAPVVVVPAEGDVAAGARSLGLATRVVALPALRWPGLAVLRSIASVRRLARQTHASLLHANGSRAMFYAGVAARLAGRPVVWHVRVADRDRPLDRLLVALADAVVVNSKAVERRFAWAPPAKVRRIPNGVDLARFVPRDPPQGLRASLGIPEGVPVVGSIGRFVPYKGYHHLLDAARLVAEKVPEAHWVLVGDGELRGALEEQRRALGLERVVHFAGWQPRVGEHLALFDLFVLPSLGEHFGRVLLEAMAMAKAVVATDAGGVPEIVLDGETGLLVPPADPRAMAEAVVTLLQDPVRAARMGEAGRRRVASEFSLSRHVEAVEALYREVLGTDRGGL